MIKNQNPIINNINKINNIILFDKKIQKKNF